MASDARENLGRIGNSVSCAGQLVSCNVVGPAGAARGVGGGVDAGESAKLVGEVRLIVVTAVEREFSPANVFTRMQLAYGTLESLNAAPDFRRKSYLFAKDLRKAAFAPADLARGFTNAGDIGDALEVAKGKADLN
jgi:hypothetical protein